MAPIAINVYLMTEGTAHWLAFALAFSAEYAVYEIGYIYNDTYTAGKEASPTKWVPPEYKDYVKNDYPILIASRVFFIGVAFNLLCMLRASNVGLFGFLMAALYCDFTAHNYFRNAANVFTDGILQLLKYCSPMVLFLRQTTDLRFFVYIVLQIALVRALEFAIGKKYFFKKLQVYSIDFLRVIYYLGILAVAAAICVVSGSAMEMLPGTLFLLGYRVFCMILSKSKKISDERNTNSHL